jgi:D-3-phosphoglycerate dehydrogenase
LGLTPRQLQSAIAEYEGLIVRSQTSVTRQIIESGTKLEVIARAGVGVDNIDIEAATRRGVFVINSREGNIVSTAEHTMAMLLALARQIPKANSELRAGVWNRSLKGVEVRNKVLGIIGFGRVGTAVAEMAKALRMNVIAHDPMVSQSIADRLGVQLVELGTLLAKSDFVSVHVPLNQSTKGLIGNEQLKRMKSTAMVINCARGGIIDEQALYDALEAGRLAGAALDVFSEEPAVGNILVRSDKTVVTPHLAASTSEAEESSAIDIAEQIVAVLSGYPPRSPVNAPLVSAEGMTAVREYLRAASTLGVIGAQMLEGQAKSITIRYQGEISEQNTDPIKAAVLGGLLENVTDERVNIVNMHLVASSRGLRITEERDSACENYSSMLTVEINTTSGKVVVASSLLRGSVYLVRVNDFWFEIEPTGTYLLFTEHKDQPGMIGAVGTIMGSAGINISQMQVSRDVQRGGRAMMVICLDDPLTADAGQRMLAIPDMYKVHVVKLVG